MIVPLLALAGCQRMGDQNRDKTHENSRAAPIVFNHDIRPILSDNCFACHGPDKKQRKAGLRLDDGKGAFKKLRSGSKALVRGDRAASELFHRISTGDLDERMPPADSEKSLSPGEIALLGKWIDQGAPWQKHWSFIEPVRPSPPGTRDKAWPRNAIDDFILARLESEGLAPSPPADRATLIRRVYLDLIGLPPSIAEVEQFAADKQPQAYETLIDGLLASPHFGERWGRHWLDAARFADSNGYSVDAPRSVWKYRDWVIDAINRDLPFDRFVVEQIAGDLLPGATMEQKIATGFHRNTMINQEGGIDQEEFRIEAVVDRVNTTGAVFLGLTIGCARCHDHKYDPITQREYYQLFDFFNGDDELRIETAPAQEIARRDAIDEQIKTMRNSLNQYLAGFAKDLHETVDHAFSPEAIENLSPEQLKACKTSPAQRSPEQKQIVQDLIKENDPEYRRRWDAITEVKNSGPRIPKTLVLRRRNEPRPSFVLIQGDFTRQGDSVAAGVPAVLHAMPALDHPPTRLDLAEWIIDPHNPLTARVTVNRFWQRLFARGLVETENDFGIQGSPPTHPELLDWLATEFIARGWSRKAILRLIVTSATYRQSSRARPDLQEIDPNNRLLARQSRLRLDAEIIRDAGLTASGLLYPMIGGPSVYPSQPDGVMALGQQNRKWETSAGGDRYRRGMYTFFWRATPHPALMVFDAPDAMKTCTRRNRSNTPLQALTLLNDEAFFEMARALAKRLIREAPGDDHQRIEHAFGLCLARAPTEREASMLQRLLDRRREAPVEPPELDEWTSVARVMLNLDEFITRE